MPALRCYQCGLLRNKMVAPIYRNTKSVEFDPATQKEVPVTRQELVGHICKKCYAKTTVQNRPDKKQGWREAFRHNISKIMQKVNPKKEG